ncbi:glycerophosphodiester phosphodiesterase family protein [Defluviimonas sp. WL0075]|uniref:Glycerophosphodiester phosphodiesterase family protein n=1 Tax=Albidovulum sediminicola TaxID=2984331 RepID=A0ABT2YW77_9RHOB|nr:glycerophosphodiester phosphodiesterase family protein [Defluviimonas sp. WL0075]MCV2863114.1 glycerophosphodiester phosphodiesterase family protein [Defluviimonas sp. WL0075]
MYLKGIMIWSGRRAGKGKIPGMHAKFALAAMSLLGLLLPTTLFAQVSFEERLTPGKPPLVIAHRSAVMGGAPENSLAAIQYALDRGIEAIHINPQLTADGQYVLMHDHTLNRTTDVESVFPEGPPGGPSRESRGGKDYVRDYSLEQVRQLTLVDAADGGDLHVPTLAEALDLADGRLLVLLGLKTYEVDSLAAALQGRDTRNLRLFELYYSGTDQSKLRDATLATGIDVAVSLFQSRDYLSDFEEVFAQVGSALRMVNVRSTRLTPEFVARLKALGICLAIGAGGPEDSALVNNSDPAPWRELLDRGFAAATDQPDLVLKALGK